MQVIDTNVFLDLENGLLTGRNVELYRKTYKEMAPYFDHADSSIDDQTIMYEVYSVKEKSPDSGELEFGVSVLKPVIVSGQANMTRGHFHSNRECSEYYFGLAGQGLLLLMNQQNECWAEKVSRGSVHHISGSWAHRLVNTGTVDLKVGCCWPAASGHDYDSIVRQPFRCRVYLKDGQVQLIEDRK